GGSRQSPVEPAGSGPVDGAHRAAVGIHDESRSRQPRIETDDEHRDARRALDEHDPGVAAEEDPQRSKALDEIAVRSHETAPASRRGDEADVDPELAGERPASGAAARRPPDQEQPVVSERHVLHRRLARGGPPVHATNSSSSLCTFTSMSNVDAARSRPAAPRRARRSPSSRRAARASASAGASRGGTSSPVRPSWTASGIPEWRVDTTGSPIAIASRITFGIPSRSPSCAVTLGRTKSAASAYFSRAASWDRAPTSPTRSAIRSSPSRASSAARSGPSPTISHSKARSRSASNRIASSRYRNP